MKFNEKLSKYLKEVEGKSLDDLKNSDIGKILSQIDVSQQSAGQGLELVTVDVSKLDKLWKDSGDPAYINKDMVKKKYFDAIEFLLLDPKERKSKHDADYINASEVDVAEDAVGVTQGRHRYAALRDAGVKKLPVGMTTDSIVIAKKLGIV